MPLKLNIRVVSATVITIILCFAASSCRGGRTRSGVDKSSLSALIGTELFIPQGSYLYPEEDQKAECMWINNHNPGEPTVKIVTYIDAKGCAPCEMKKLALWMPLIRDARGSIDSDLGSTRPNAGPASVNVCGQQIGGDVGDPQRPIDDSGSALQKKDEFGEENELVNGKPSLDFIFIISGASEQTFRQTLREVGFRYPVLMDRDGEFAVKNQLAENPYYHTYLIGVDNKIALIGTPIYNSRMWEHYKSVAKSIN